MTILSGENGAIYFNEELTDTATTGSIEYSSTTGGYFITSSTNDGAAPGGVIDFETDGWEAGMLFTLSNSSTGFVGNDRIFTITAVSSGVLTVAESVTTGVEIGTPTFTEAEPGIEVLGFYNWTLSYSGDALEMTSFSNSSGGRNYIPGLTSWTLTAESYFLSTGVEQSDWVGATVEIRPFINYVATPSTDDVCNYWKGDTVVVSLDINTPVDAIVNQSISFQGDGELEFKAQTQAWNLGITTM